MFAKFIYPAKAYVLLLNALVLGLSGAAVFPVLGLYLDSQHGASPLQLGFFLAVNGVLAVTSSQLLARFSDRGLSRKLLVQLSNLASIGACFLLASAQTFNTALLAGAIIAIFSSTGLPQLFAIGREQVTGDNARMFQSVMRTMIAISWAFGPATAFVLAEVFGYATLFTVGAGCYALSLLISTQLPRAVLQATQQVIDKVKVRDYRPWLLVLAFVFLFAANNLYLVGMPLYITKILAWPESYVGFLMSTAAALEIPVMIATGLLTGRVRYSWMMLWAALSAVIFFAILISTQNVLFWFVAQIFNGMFIGVAAAAGISYFQDLMPEQLGTASTLYNNAIKVGGVLGTLAVAMVGHFVTYAGVLPAALISTVIALLVFIVLHWVQKLGNYAIS